MRLVLHLRHARPSKRRLAFALLFEAGTWYLIQRNAWGTRQWELAPTEVDRFRRFVERMASTRPPWLADPPTLEEDVP